MPDGMLFIACAVGTTACFGVCVGARTAEFLLLVQEHLYAKASHHQGDNSCCNSEYYQCFF